MIRIAVCVLTGALLLGCASKPAPFDPATLEVRRPERLVPWGLVKTQNRTDVATLAGGVEYALFPNFAAQSQALMGESPQAARENLRRLFDTLSMSADLCDQGSDPGCASPR